MHTPLDTPGYSFVSCCWSKPDVIPRICLSSVIITQERLANMWPLLLPLAKVVSLFKESDWCLLLSLALTTCLCSLLVASLTHYSAFLWLSVFLGLFCFYYCVNSRAVVAKLGLWLACFFSHILLLESLADLRSLSDLISNTKWKLETQFTGVKMNTRAFFPHWCSLMFTLDSALFTINVFSFPLEAWLVNNLD